MRRVTVGSSGVVCSALGFGTASLLRNGGARRRQDILAAALAAGITHFDTAPIYGLGESERALGRFLQGKRHRATLTTKFGLHLSTLAARMAPAQRLARRLITIFPALRSTAVRSAPSLYAPDFGVAAVRHSLERSLRALRTDYIDFALAHECSAERLPGDELVAFLKEMQRQGKIRDYGIAASAGHTPAVMRGRPALGRIVQLESDPFAPNVDTLQAGSRHGLITHGALARALHRTRHLLQNDAVRSHHWKAELGVDLRDERAVGALFLRAAVLANPGGVVLIQSGSPDHIHRNANSADNTSLDLAAQRLRALVREEPPHDS